jgi:outer membrane protein OmpA-like peptidoglycan-associated protein
MPMFARRLEHVTRRVALPLGLAVVVVVAGGCFTAARDRAPEPDAAEHAGVATTPAPAITDEELVGPPAPFAAPELEGPPEPVGPPLPVAEAPAGSAPAPVAEARVTEPDAQLIAALEHVGANVHPSARGPVVVLPDTIFELGTSTLQRDAKRKVHAIGRVVSERAFRSRVAVEGHSDSTGAEMYNRGLSERRASAVATELGSAGVAQRLLSAKGYGSQFPIAPNERADGSDDPLGRARNRRVEIVVETASSPGG